MGSTAVTAGLAISCKAYTAKDYGSALFPRDALCSDGELLAI